MSCKKVGRARNCKNAHAQLQGVSGQVRHRIGACPVFYKFIDILEIPQYQKVVKKRSKYLFTMKNNSIFVVQY